MYSNIGKRCPKCNSDHWMATDNKATYIEICSECTRNNVFTHIEYKKADIYNSFVCDKCGSTHGTMHDNKCDLTIVCNECGTSHIMIEKREGATDNRNIEPVRPIKKDTHVVCPKCGSTQITTGQRGFSLITGFIGSNKTVNRCARCGYSWKPKL